MKPLIIAALVLLTLTPVSAGDRWRGYDRDPQWSPYSERFEGSRRWKPDTPWGWDRPDRIIIDKPGKCEVRCEREGRAYRCREYRC